MIIAIFSVILIVSFITLAIIITPDINLSEDYDEAVSIYNNGNYDRAIVLFEELGDYGDSDELLKDSIYKKSNNYALRNDWVAAIDAISQIVDYKDSENLLNEYNYNYALEKIENKEWQVAIELLEGSDKDVKALINQCKYELALEEYHKNNWETATGLFAEIKDYKDSELLIYQCGINKVLGIEPIFPEEYILPDMPVSISDFEDVITYMAVSNIMEYDIIYKGTFSMDYFSSTLSDNVFDAFQHISNLYIENFSHIKAINVLYKIDGTESTFTIKLESDYIDEYKTEDYYKKFRLEAYKVINDLIEEGQLTSHMSDKEKAKVLYEWVAYNLEYDTKENLQSFNGYGAITTKKAVCQGYTALYNLLCKIVGIDVIGVANIDHIWTLANLEGELLYIDTTWGDPVPDEKNYCNMEYFAVDEETFSKSHKWDKEAYYSQIQELQSK